MDFELGKTERAVKHWMIAASAGENYAMDNLLIAFRHGDVRRNDIDATLTAYNNSCAEMRSEARDESVHIYQTKMVTICRPDAYDIDFCYTGGGNFFILHKNHSRTNYLLLFHIPSSSCCVLYNIVSFKQTGL
jgi:hypothetical protein